MNRKEAADAREKETGMRQSTGAMVAKIAVGALFVVSGLTTDWAKEATTSDPLGTAVISIVIGLALIAWGLLPYLSAKKKRAQAAAEAAAEKAAAEQRTLNAPWVCSACGASTKGLVCEYCGTPKPKDRRK